MSVPIYQVDAFVSDRKFSGNPAGVCILPEKADDAWMQNVAMEMNVSETAFLVKRSDGYDLRWFTPSVEVALCGHATLASAHVLWETGQLGKEMPARFHTKSGLLTAERREEFVEIDLPAVVEAAETPPPELLIALGITAQYAGKNRFDYLIEVESESIVRGIRPDFTTLRKLPVRGVMVTSRSQDPAYDIVSRFFAPGAGVDEDPVTGSAHCCLAPYWSAKLGKTELVAYQASPRGGVLHLKVAGDRVKLAGTAVTALRGELL
ncbi:MAG TPA: PhzF family phenazine biosynthesis protein [Bacteroidota bacterium]|jgi:PhzF family phenazine biosynthesis protein|nr:PhzF family phenazine biosynthesis protein [Bacteroidota bacterium]